MSRTWAIIERELRRFRRSPMLIIVSMIFPVVQLVVLGYAFGGNVKHLKVGLVDQDGGLPAVRVRELAGAVASGARTIDIIEYGDQGVALTDLRDGRINGVLTIPPDYSRRVLAQNAPRIALIEDNTDGFVSGTLAATMNGVVGALSPKARATERVSRQPTLDVVEVRRYDAHLTLLGAAHLKGGAYQGGLKGIYEAFLGSAADMRLIGNRLVVHMGRLLYAIDGVHHQSNLTFEGAEGAAAMEQRELALTAGLATDQPRVLG